MLRTVHVEPVLNQPLKQNWFSVSSESRILDDFDFKSVYISGQSHPNLLNKTLKVGKSKLRAYFYEVERVESVSKTSQYFVRSYFRVKLPFLVKHFVHLKFSVLNMNAL